MTVKDLLADIDLKNPNDVQPEIKRGWLLTQEKQLLHEVLHTHMLTSEEKEKAAALADLVTLDDDYEPVAQPPYQDLYIHYVNAQIALANVDTVAYENAQALYNNALLTYKNWFNRTHRTLNGIRGWRV
ncbi:MAG: hypothetical protein IJT99_01200 [Clostridia bacterium]|nr:hypothetical protein [Clostridia bacterium]